MTDINKAKITIFDQLAAKQLKLAEARRDLEVLTAEYQDIAARHRAATEQMHRLEDDARYLDPLERAVLLAAAEERDMVKAKLEAEAQCKANGYDIQRCTYIQGSLIGANSITANTLSATAQQIVDAIGNHMLNKGTAP